MNDIERHVQQTTDRLHCIKQQLQSPTDFQHAARELLEWCMDDRAFQPHFEAPLFNCLAVVGRVSSQHGFDLDLGYRLLSVCAAHHDKFSVKSAGLLTSWSEELGQMLLQRQQLKRTIGGGPTASAADFKQRLAADGSFYAAANERQMVSKPPMAGSARYSSVPASWQHPQNSAVQQWDSISHSEKMLSNTGPGFNEEHQQQQLVDHTMAVAGPLQQIQHHQQHNGSVQAMQASMVPGSVTGNGSVYSKSGPGAAYCSNGTVGNPSFNNGYPPTPTSPGNSSTQSGALLGDAVMTGDSSVAMTTTLTTAAPPVTMATNASSYGNGWQRNDGSSVGARAPNDVVFNGHRQQQTRMYAADAYGNSQYYPQQYCGPSRGQVPQSSSSLHRYYPYPPSSSRLGVPLQSNMVHDVAGGTHHHHHHHSASSSLQSPYPANAQQYMKCKRAMCPTSMQPVYGLYRSSQAQSPYYPARSVVAHGHQPALPIQSQSRAGVHYGIGEVQPVNHASYHGQNGVTNSGFGQSPEYTSSHQPEYSISTDGDPSLLLETQAYNNQHQLPGNPTPPITPGSCGSTAYSTAVRSSANELTEPCMTFPLPDGIIMPPFRLQHNLAVSNHVFRLNESVYQALACRSDLELQLKCFHHEDREMTTNWPASVMVSVNANPMTIDVHRPINVRDVCQLGRNTIQITVMACCCSHMFVLQLVHRPVIRLVVTSLLRKQMLSTEQSIAKLKQHCMSTEGVKLSLVCPITLAQIKLPARGRDCHHLQCFDVEAYLSLNSERSLWRCPICKRTVALEEIEVDQLLWSILETQRASATIGDEVVVDVAQMSWRVITKTGSVLDETGNGSLLTSVPLAASLQPNVDTWLTSSSMGNKVITDPDHEGMSHSPDILTSLAQMGDSLEQIPMEMNPADAPPGSQQTPDLSNLPPVGALVNEGVSSPLAHRGSPEIGALQLKEVDITNAPTPPAAAVDFAGAPAIPTPPDTTGVSSASSTCMISSVTSLESLTGAEGHQSPTDSIDTSFHSDLSLDMLVTESAIGDPSELLAYLGPSDSDAGFGSSEDLLSLFSPE